MIIGSKLIYYKNLPSTNSEAVSLLRDKKLSEGTVIHTGFQTAGRGHGGNKWESGENKNLLISIILYPSTIRPSDQFLLSMTISLGICDFLGHYIPSISIKWPNDIYVKDDKIAGILIENSVMGDQIEHSVAGIGININQEKFLGDAPNPVSLAILTGTDHDLRECLVRLLSDLDKRYKELVGGDYGHIRKDYMSRLYRSGTWGKFSDQQGRFTGKILSVGDTGKLIIEKEDGSLNEYGFKDVEFIQ